MTLSCSQRTVFCRAAGASDQGRAGHWQQRGKHASVLGRLQPFILARIEELEATLEHRAISDFNNWLVGLAQCKRC